MSLWCEAHPEATLEERAEAWRVVMMALALDACGLCKRRDKDWFAANRDELMPLVAARNTARAAYFRSGGNLQLKLVAQAATKALKTVERRPRRAFSRTRWRRPVTASGSSGARCAPSAVAAIRGRRRWP